MKNFVIGFLMCALCVTCMAMTVREGLYQQFGPKIVEAVVQVVQDEFNRNRTWHSQPQITDAQMLSAITNKLSQIPDYEWQHEGPQ